MYANEAILDLLRYLSHLKILYAASKLKIMYGNEAILDLLWCWSRLKILCAYEGSLRSCTQLEQT
jgi:hypothetical protein